jgi:YggT family protein
VAIWKGALVSVIGALLGLVLLLFEIVLIARLVRHWVGALAPAGGVWSIRARSLTHALTEPVIAPVRRVLHPIRVGSVGIDIAFTVVFVAVVILRSVVVGL